MVKKGLSRQAFFVFHIFLLQKHKI
jgi:hypothetical protein